MAGSTVELVDRLLQAEAPHTVQDWEQQDGYYVATCRISTEDIPGLFDILRKWNDQTWPDEEGPADLELLPVTAWRALGDLKAEGSVGPLIEFLKDLNETDDWACDDLPHVFGKIGDASLDPLVQIATDEGIEGFIRSIAVRGLGCLANYHADTRDRIVACLTRLMTDARDDRIVFNTSILHVLVDLQAVEAAEPIERAFAANLLDAGLLGDWDHVRQTLGVEGLGLTMPKRPNNSIERLRRQMGIGIFSGRPVFGIDEVDPKAEEAYYRRAYNSFSKSREAQQIIDQFGELRWFERLLEFGVSYRGETVDLMTQESVDEFLFDYVPRKCAVDPTAAAEIVGELIAFWEYVDRVYHLPDSKLIADWLKSDGVVDQLKDQLSDSSNFGMAKSLLMMGQEAGFDMTSQADVNRFILAYNASLASARKAPAPTAAKQRVGRNEPCPCGSGKKFKKCCGGSH